MPRKKETAHVTAQYPFPTRLRELMKEKGTTQKELGDAIGVRPQTISLYTQGQSSPDVNGLTKIAQYFSVSADYLLGLSEARTFDADIRHMVDTLGISEDGIERMVAINQRHEHAGDNPFKAIAEAQNFSDFIVDLQFYARASAKASPQKWDNGNPWACLTFGGEDGWNMDESLYEAATLLESNGYSVLQKKDEAYLRLTRASETLKRIFEEAVDRGVD